jgi:threonine aldolase
MILKKSGRLKNSANQTSFICILMERGSTMRLSKKKRPSYGEIFGNISVCLNKGLMPCGQYPDGRNWIYQKARRVRKVMGGGMRQAGYMALGIYA